MASQMPLLSSGQALVMRLDERNKRGAMTRTKGSMNVANRSQSKPMLKVSFPYARSNAGIKLATETNMAGDRQPRTKLSNPEARFESST